jgi:hypothetical protein
MIISYDAKHLTYKCDFCSVQKTVNKRKDFFEKKKHKCRTCHALEIALSGGEAMKAKAEGTDYYLNVGKRLRQWCAENGNISCKAGGHAATLVGAQSKAGKIGGRKTAESGKLLSCATQASKSPETRKKIWETKKKNGMLKQSKVELAFYEELKLMFGEARVKHHVHIFNHEVDFFIVPDFYIELDGIYWHGLDKPYEDLSPLIKRKFDRDRILDENCRQNNIKLIRISDLEFKQGIWRQKLEGLS